MNGKKKTPDDSIEPTDFQTADQFESPQTENGQNVSVTLNTASVNFHASNLSALERIADKNPDLALRLVESTEAMDRSDYKRYRVGAFTALTIACMILICSTIVITFKGFWAGMAFFAACAAVSAILSVIFTGKSQDLSWVINLWKPGGPDKPDSE